MTYDNKFLIENEACREGYAWAQTQTDRGHGAFLRAAAEKDFSYFTWCVKKSLDRHQSVEFARYCAELVLPIFERGFPDDDRPREAIAARAEYAAPACAADRAAAYAARAAAAADEADEAKTIQKIVEKAVEILNGEA